MRNTLLFEILPYAAVTICTGVLLLRGVRFWRDPRALEADLTEARRVFAGGALWKGGLLALLAGHLLVLALPAATLAWNRAPARLYLLEGVAFLAALAALAGAAGVVARHLRAARERPLPGLLADACLISVLATVLLSGTLLAVWHRWASSWAAATVAPYTASVVRGQADPALLAELPFLVQLHVATALAALLLLGFSGLGVMLLAPVLGATRGLTARGRAAAAPLLVWGRRHHPRRWRPWPDDDSRDLPPPAPSLER